MALQVANAQVADLNGDIVFLDYERGLNNPKARICQICNITEDEYNERFTIFNQVDMSTEFFKRIVFDIIEMKKKLSAKDMIEWYDFDGQSIKIYPPTIIILDSIPSMKPEEVLKEKDLDSNMIPGKMAAANKAVVGTVINLLEQYNITVYAINHITTKININPYAPKKVQLPGLGEVFAPF